MLTLLVLLIDASVKSRSPAPVRSLAGQAWYDRVQPLIQQSTVSGHELDALRTGSKAITASVLQSDLQDLVTSTRTTLASYQKLRAPASLESSAGLLETALLVRSQASASLAAAVRQQLARSATASLTAATTTLTRSAEQLQVADEAYRLFAGALPSWLGVRAPASVWVASSALYDASGLQVWLTALRSRISLAPVHRVAIVAVSTDPAPIGRRGSVEVLTPSNELVVTVVVGDTGNQTESDLTVSAALSRSTGVASVRSFVSLGPGGAHAITFDPLGIPIGVDVVLTVTITPAAGSTTPAQVSRISLLMPSSTSGTTTTTTTVPGSSSSTTVAGGTTGTGSVATTTTSAP